jgi:hypothetical protein
MMRIESITEQLNRKDRKEKTQRTQSHTRTPCVLCVFFVPFAVKLTKKRRGWPCASVYRSYWMRSVRSVVLQKAKS